MSAETSQNVLFKPFKGPQTEFLSSSEREVLHVGGRGSAKTDALLAEPLRYLHLPDFKVLILRKQMKHLIELIARAKALYMGLFPTAKWREQDKMLTFPNGATVIFAYFEDEADIERYQGQQYQMILIDELTHLAREELLDKLLASLRGGNPEIPKFFRATANPGGIGWNWVRNRFILPSPLQTVEYVDELGEKRTYRKNKHAFTIESSVGTFKITRKCIVSTIMNNPYLLKNDPSYVMQLASIKNENLRRMWFLGDVDVVDGCAFSEFSQHKHVIKPFPIPSNWAKFRACDWGFGSMGVVLWFAKSPEGVLYVYREYVFKGQNADVVAQTILLKEEEEYIGYGVLDSQCWELKGNVSESIAKTMNNFGLRWRPAGNKGKGVRVHGKMLVHHWLTDNPNTEKPRLLIFDTCKELIEELTFLPLDPNNLEDVDTDATDHAYDALKYGLMTTKATKTNSFVRATPPKPIQVVGMMGF